MNRRFTCQRLLLGLRSLSRLVVFNLMCLIAFIVGSAFALADDAIMRLMPDEVMSLTSFWTQVRGIDDRPWTAFKDTARATLVDQIARYVEATGKPEEAVSRLVETEFRCCLESKYGPDLERLKRPVVDGDRVKENGDGTLHVSMPEDLAEMLWILGAVEPWLSESARTWGQSLKPLNRVERHEWIEKAVLSALHDYVMAQQRHAKLELLLAQPQWLRQFVAASAHIDLTVVQRDLKGFEGSDEPKRLIEGLSATTSQAEILRVNARIKELRAALRRERVLLAPKLLSHCESLVLAFRSQGATLSRLESYYRKLFDLSYIDLPPQTGTNGGTPFFRFHIEIPSNRDCAGLETRIDVKVSICRWIGQSVGVTSANGTGAILFDQNVGSTDKQTIPADKVLEEIPTGLSISGVIFREGGKLSLPTGSTPKVACNEVAMAKALQRLGLPQQLVPKNFSVRVPSFESFVISAKIAAPTVGSGFLFDSSRVEELRDVELRIDLASLQKGAIETALNASVEKLQEKFDASLRETLIAASAKSPFRIEKVVSAGDWKKGTVAYDVTFRLLRVGEWEIPAGIGTWTAPTWCRREGNEWKIGVGSASVPTELIDFLRKKLAEAVCTPFRTSLAGSEFDSLQKHIAELEKYVVFEGVVFHPAERRISGSLRCGTELLPADSAFKLDPISVGIDLSKGNVSTSLSGLQDQLKAAGRLMLTTFLQKLNGELSQAAADTLAGIQIDLLGAKLAVLNDPKPKAEGGHITFTVRGQVFGKTIEAQNIHLLGGTISEAGIEKPRFDFRALKLSPEPGAFVSQLLGLDTSVLRFGQVNKTIDGVCFPLSVRIEELGGDIALGEVQIRPNGIVIGGRPLNELPAQLAELIKQHLLKQMGGTLVVKDLGPVRELTVDKLNIADGKIEAWLKGRAEVPGLKETFIPFRARVVPAPQVIEIDENAAAAAALTGLRQLLPEEFLAGVDSPVKNPQPITQAPYGVQFDLEMKAWVFTVAAKGVRFTTKGIELPASIAIQPPGMIPVPTAFAIVDPGVVVPLDRDGEIGIVGDVTLASKGIDKIIKLKCVLSTGTRHIGTFKLDGTLILVDMLPLLKVEGTAVFSAGTLDMNARTVGFVDKIIQVRDRMHVEAAKGLFEQNGSIGVLGFQLANTNIKIDAFRPALTAKAGVRLPIAQTEVGLTASPNLSDFAADARFEVGLGGFTLQSAELHADARVVDLKFHVVIFDVRVLAPSITTLTPERVLEAILSLFDFDIKAFFDAIIDRKITVSFFDRKGNPTNGSIGQGDPLPPDSRPTRSDKLPPQQTSSSNQSAGGMPGAVASSTTQPGPSPTPGTSTATTTSGGTPTKGDEPPIEQLIQMREMGDTVYQIIPDPVHAGLFVEKYKWREHEWYGWMSLSPAVADHLLRKRDVDGGKVVAVHYVWRSLTESEQSALKGRDGTPALWICGYVTVNASGKVHVAERTPNGRVVPIELDLSQIGPPGTGRTVEQTLSLLQSRETDDAKRFTYGDFEVIRYVAQQGFVPGYGPAALRRRVPAMTTSLSLGGKPLSRPEAYLLTVTDERKREFIAFQPRVGNPFLIEKTDLIAQHLKLTGESDLSAAGRTASAIALLSSAAASGVSIGYIFGEEAGPLLFRTSNQEKPPKFELWSIRDDGTFGPPVTLSADTLDSAPLATPYFGQPDNTGLFGRQLAAEVSSGNWHEVRLREFEAGIARTQFLPELFQLRARLKDIDDVQVKNTDRWLTAARARSEGRDSEEVRVLTADQEANQKARRGVAADLNSLEAKRELRSVVAWSVCAPDDPSKAPSEWKFVLLTRTSEGEVRRYPKEGAFSGQKLADAYASWTKTQIKSPPHATIDSVEARRWLIDEFLQPERGWTARWKSDPVTLLRSIE